MILYLLSRAKHAKFSQHLLRVGYNNPLLNVLCLYVIIPQCCDNLSLLFDTLFNSELSRAWHTSLSKFSMELKTAGTVLQPHLMHVVTSTFGQWKDKNTRISIAINTLILRLNAWPTSKTNMNWGKITNKSTILARGHLCKINKLKDQPCTSCAINDSKCTKNFVHCNTALK